MGGNSDAFKTEGAVSLCGERLRLGARPGNGRGLGDLGRRPPTLGGGGAKLSRAGRTWLRPPGLVFFPRTVNSQKGSEASAWQRTGEETFQNYSIVSAGARAAPPPPRQSPSVSLEPGESRASLSLLKRRTGRESACCRIEAYYIGLQAFRIPPLRKSCLYLC